MLGQGVDQVRLGCNTHQNVRELDWGKGSILWENCGLASVGLEHLQICAKIKGEDRWSQDGL